MYDYNNNNYYYYYYSYNRFTTAIGRIDLYFFFYSVNSIALYYSSLFFLMYYYNTIVFDTAINTLQSLLLYKCIVVIAKKTSQR